ncbi:MAG: hypothetical protein CMJ81_14545 [Planctomycetaceae bacterium]|nr:hypothetical protein [Planctomycetaceae bacterium]MBP60902.1 hypothetical protein [Planctomycetaceae bacterium]
MAEVRWVIDRWRLDYNHHRMHSALNYQIPAAYAAGCILPASATEHSRFTNPDSLTQACTKMGGGYEKDPATGHWRMPGHEYERLGRGGKPRSTR